MSRSKRFHFAAPWTVSPYVLWMGLFLLGPLVLIFVMSLQTKGAWGGVRYDWSGLAYKRLFDPVYGKVLWASVKLAARTAVSCFLVGYPMAWYMSRLPHREKRFAMLLVLLPLMSNFVARAYAVKFLVGADGPVNRLLLSVGLISEPLFLDSPQLIIWIGMMTNYLPFFVLPLFVVIERFDYSLIEAARDLGASWWVVWWRVIWPMTRRAAYTGMILVFVPAMGEFIIPDLMGGGKTMFLGNLMTEQFLKTRDWPFGAAICVFMMIAIVVVALLVPRDRRV
jgi:spermidine/putrescine transport system permease protein